MEIKRALESVSVQRHDGFQNVLNEQEWTEFVEALMIRSESWQRMRSMFRVMDRDVKGRITREDWHIAVAATAPRVSRTIAGDAFDALTSYQTDSLTYHDLIDLACEDSSPSCNPRSAIH
jgi:Ca2+-binding EF-hand superfamily protein